MLITEILEHNARLYGPETALVEREPAKNSRRGRSRGEFDQAKPDCDFDEEAVADFCMDLPRYKRPRQIIFAGIPRNPTGKIEKPVSSRRYRQVPAGS